MTVHVSTTGNAAGPTVVFLHGQGVSSWMWGEQVESLADQFRCVTIDLPGSGASHAEPWVSLSAAAGTVAEVITDVTGGDAANVVGLSLGGYVSLALLVEHPHLVDSAVVSGVTTRPLTPTWVYGPITRANVALMRVPAVARVAATAMRLPEDARAAFVADGARLSKDTARRIYAEVLPYRLPPLGVQAARLLAVAGDREVKPVRNGLADLAAAGATAAVVPRAHHVWNAEHPELFSRMIDSWVRHRALPPELDPVPSARAAPHTGG